MMRRIVLLIPICFVLLAAPGCAHRAAFVAEPHLSLGALAPGLTAPEQGFALLADIHTEGRFACTLAVAKFALPVTNRPTQDAVAKPEPERVEELAGAADAASTSRPVQGEHIGLVFMPLSSIEQAALVEQLRGVEALRDVQFLRPLTTRPDGQSLDDLLAAARRIRAALLLVYAPNAYGPNAAQVLGVLYETEGGHPLATLRTAAHVLDAEGCESSPDELKGDHRTADARWLAQQAFERETLACLRELIHRDTPPTTTQPHDIWHTAPLERWWIHYR
jgi:hypothetical protein